MKKKMLKAMALVMAAIMILALSGCGSKIYDNAEIKKIYDEDGKKAVGSYSLIMAESKDVTDKVLNDWYFNYVKDGTFSYAIIYYTDQKDKGVFGVIGAVYKDVSISKDENGDYGITDIGSGTMYTVEDDQLVEQTT